MNHEEHWTQHNHEQLDELQTKLFDVLDRTLAAHDRIARLNGQLLAKLHAYTKEAGKATTKGFTPQIHHVTYGPKDHADPVEESK